jgi:hypothetical protein
VLSLSQFNLFLLVFYSLARLPSKNRLDGSLPGADVRKASKISAGSASSTAPTSTCKKKSWLLTMQSRNNASKLASVSGNHSKPLFRTRKSCGGFSWVGCCFCGKTALELTPSTIIRKSSLKRARSLSHCSTFGHVSGITANCTVSIARRSSNPLAFQELPLRCSQLASSASLRLLLHCSGS